MHVDVGRKEDAPHRLHLCSIVLPRACLEGRSVELELSRAESGRGEGILIGREDVLGKGEDVVSIVGVQLGKWDVSAQVGK